MISKNPGETHGWDMAAADVTDRREPPANISNSTFGDCKGCQYRLERDHFRDQSTLIDCHRTSQIKRGEFTRIPENWRISRKVESGEGDSKSAEVRTTFSRARRKIVVGKNCRKIVEIL
jgi:hypothetical protein